MRIEKQLLWTFVDWRGFYVFFKKLASTSFQPFQPVEIDPAGRSMERQYIKFRGRATARRNNISIIASNHFGSLAFRIKAGGLSKIISPLHPIKTSRAI
jgi:hypothetical protein